MISENQFETRGGDDICGVRVKEIKEEEMKVEEYPFLVQGPTKFSQSIIWEQMRSFYESQGVEAWAKGIVPFFITCNAFIANSYAKVIHAYLNDLHIRGELCFNEPVYILELGCGSGKFSFLLLKALLERLELCYGDQVPFRIKYVMTDFCATAFNFWREHMSLKRYILAGLLDFAQFDACQDTDLHLQISNKVITPGSLSNPPIVVANYLFDSLPADAFRIKQGEILEGHVSICSKKEETNPEDPGILNRFRPKYDWIPWTQTPDTPRELVAILEWYKSHFGAHNDASFLIPTASFECLSRIKNFSSKPGGQLMVISGDKGISQTTGFQQGDQIDPHIAVHGSFSLMVNYHAIGLWFDAKGGFALHCPLEDSSLKVSTFTLHERSPETQPIATSHWNYCGDPLRKRLDKFFSMRIAFQDTMKSFAPDHFFQLQQASFHPSEDDKDIDREVRIKSLIGLLQLSDWDADLVFKFREVILDCLNVCSTRLLEDLKRGISRAWENYFLLEPEKDLCFELGRFYYGLQEYEKALIFYSKSSEYVGKHHVTEHNIGLCHSSLGNKSRSLGFFRSSLEMNPGYTKAKEQQDLIRQQLNIAPATNEHLKRANVNSKTQRTKDGRVKLSLLNTEHMCDITETTKSPLHNKNIRISFDPELLLDD